MEEQDDFLNDSEFEENILLALKNEPEDELQLPQANHLKTLKKFGHSTFRPLQWKIISSIIKDKRDNCAVMATGYGKSLCFQYPSVFMGGLTLVISPLISLMEDQVLSLKTKNIPACLLGTANTQQMKTIQQILENEYSLVYLTPEFCVGEYGLSLLADIHKKLSVRLIAIDEVHCVSSWGHDFRTSYRKLGILRTVMPSVPILAVTATATPRVKKEIIQVLKLRNPQISSSSLDRPNLYFAVHPKSSNVYQDIKTLMIHENFNYTFQGPTIIYTLTKNNADKISQELEVRGIKCMSYHAGLSMSLRKEVQTKFTKGEIEVIIATIAFGMGIDKANVRNVIHYGCPSSLEGYYQEAGRAGRDGIPSQCVIFYNDQDFVTHTYLRSNLSEKSFEVKVELIDHMRKYLKIIECRRKFILSYFEGEDVKLDENKHCCDNCTKGAPAPNILKFEGVNDSGLYDFTEDIKMILSSVKGLKYSYGMLTYIDFLRGSKKEKLTKYLKHPLHGVGKDKSTEWWKEIGNMCLQKKFLQLKRMSGQNIKYECVELTKEGTSFLQNDKKILEKPSPKMCTFLKLKSNIWLSKNPSTSQSQASQQNANIAPTTINSRVSNNSTNVQTSHSMSSNDLNCNMKLLCALKEKRSALAKEQNIPLFAVATDKALSLMASNKPFTLQQIRNDKYDRFTDEKIDKFGMEFIEVIYGTKQRRTIKDILEEYPLEEYQINASTTSTYFLFRNGKSVDEIAKERNLTKGTISTQLNQFHKCGYPMKLTQFGITEEIKNTISEAISRNEPGCNQLKPIKNLCPDNITYDQVKIVLTYYRIREHLTKLRIFYEDFEDFEYQELKYVRNEEETNNSDDDLSQLVDGLLEAQNYTAEKCEEMLSSITESRSVMQDGSVTKPLKEIDQENEEYMDLLSKVVKTEKKEVHERCVDTNKETLKQTDQDKGESNLLFDNILTICNSPPNKKPKTTDDEATEPLKSPIYLNKTKELDCIIENDDEFDDILTEDFGKGTQPIKGVSVLDSPPRTSSLRRQ